MFAPYDWGRLIPALSALGQATKMGANLLPATEPIAEVFSHEYHRVGGQTTKCFHRFTLLSRSAFAPRAVSGRGGPGIGGLEPNRAFATLKRNPCGAQVKSVIVR